jgi:signal transduction histidine kinase
LLFHFQLFSTDKRYLDSCEHVLKTTTDISKKLNCLYTLSYEYGLINPRKGIAYATECLELAKQSKNQMAQLNGFNGMGNAYESLGNYDSARWCHVNSYEIAKKIGSKGPLVATLFNIATCYKEQGKYKQALDIYIEAFKKVENEKTYNSRIHYYMGEMYLMLSNYEQAIYHSKLGYKKCMEFDFEYVAYNMNVVLAKCKLQLGEIDSAIYILKITRNKLKSYTDQISYCICLNALGEAYLLDKNYEKAIECFLEELMIQEKIGNANGTCIANLNLAFSYAVLNKLDVKRIKYHLQKAENSLNHIQHNKDALMQTYKKLSKTYEIIDVVPKAYSYFKLYSEIKDELLNTERFNQMNELQTKYATEKKEKQIQTQNADLENQKVVLERNRLQIILLIVALAFFTLFSYLFYKWYKSKQKTKLMLEIQHQEQLRETALKDKENEERTRIAKDIHDELGSGLSKIKLMSDLIKKQEIQDKNVNAQLNSISETSGKLVDNMRDLIWVWNPENNNLSNLIARIREYSYDYLEEFPIEFKVNSPEIIPEYTISNEVGRNIYMIVKEILQNIVKHSYASNVELIISVNTKLKIEFIDNGKGFDSHLDFKGNGIKNLKSRSERIGASIVFNSELNKGTRVSIEIDKAGLRENKILL